MFTSIASYLGLGITLGLSAGLIPGPFQSVVISQTLKHGFWEGVKVALSVLFIDIFFILFTLVLLTKFIVSERAMGVLYLVGSAYLFKLAYENFQTKQGDFGVAEDKPPNSIRKGMLTLFLRPGSYLFWFTIGGPAIIDSYKSTALATLAFFVGLYVCFIGPNIGVAYLSYKAKTFLQSKTHSMLLRFLGVVLGIFALMFAYNGMRVLGLL
ncbi:MAG: LysE family transporter [Candidatus Pacebacteria bacterium]|nr:LysE family transporter [Candidatus Paceibacterota bacterium]PIR61243.1 MAG: hypothetical protein COU68_00445 [Candidatus Pacebacteria bacterium CG10_big_fil_rev_8_21_14_0_10_45_6]